ncbi:hypothetical protein D3C85_1829970 [compost metagenome]
MGQTRLVVLQDQTLANHRRHFQKIHPERAQDTIHVFDARLTALIQPVTHATLGHPEAVGEYILSDFEITHLGFD